MCWRLGSQNWRIAEKLTFASSFSAFWKHWCFQTFCCHPLICNVKPQRDEPQKKVLQVYLRAFPKKGLLRKLSLVRWTRFPLLLCVERIFCLGLRLLFCWVQSGLLNVFSHSSCGEKAGGSWSAAIIDCGWSIEKYLQTPRPFLPWRQSLAAGAEAGQWTFPGHREEQVLTTCLRQGVADELSSLPAAGCVAWES